MDEKPWRSAATDGADDLDPVAFGELRRRVLAARNDFAVALQRDALIRQTHALDEFGDGNGLGQFVLLTIYPDKHCGYPGLRCSAPFYTGAHELRGAIPTTTM